MNATKITSTSTRESLPMLAYVVAPAKINSKCMWCDGSATWAITDSYKWTDWACTAHTVKYFPGTVCDKRPSTCDTRPSTDPGCDWHA